MRRDQQNVIGGFPDGRHHGVRNGFAQGGLVPRLSRADLGQHHQALGAAAGIALAEHRHAALAHTWDFAHRGLDFLRVQVAATPDHDVLDPAGHEDIAFGLVSPVTGVQPFAQVVGEQARRERWRVPVASGGRRPAKFQPALDPLGHHLTRVVNDADAVPGQHPPAGHETQRRGVLARHRASLRLKGVAVDGVDARAPVQRRKQQAHRGFGQPVHRCHGRRAQPAGRKTLSKALDRVRAHCLGPVEGQPPAAQVEPSQCGIVDPVQAQLVGEVGAGRQRAAVV